MLKNNFFLKTASFKKLLITITLAAYNVFFFVNFNKKNHSKETSYSIFKTFRLKLEHLHFSINDVLSFMKNVKKEVRSNFFAVIFLF